jgi:hypothetical protein
MIQTLALHAVAAAQAETAELPRHLPMPPAAYGILALVVFLILLAITWAFRSSGTKH